MIESVIDFLSNLGEYIANIDKWLEYFAFFSLPDNAIDALPGIYTFEFAPDGTIIHSVTTLILNFFIDAFNGMVLAYRVVFNALGIGLNQWESSMFYDFYMIFENLGLPVTAFSLMFGLALPMYLSYQFIKWVFDIVITIVEVIVDIITSLIP